LHPGLLNLNPFRDSSDAFNSLQALKGLTLVALGATRVYGHLPRERATTINERRAYHNVPRNRSPNVFRLVNEGIIG